MIYFPLLLNASIEINELENVIIIPQNSHTKLVTYAYHYNTALPLEGKIILDVVVQRTYISIVQFYYAFTYLI